MFMTFCFFIISVGFWPIFIIPCFLPWRQFTTREKSPQCRPFPAENLHINATGDLATTMLQLFIESMLFLWILLHESGFVTCFQTLPSQPRGPQITWHPLAGQLLHRSPLPLWFAILPFLFNHLADAFQRLLKTNYHIQDLMHYLNVYFMVGPSKFMPSNRSLYHRTPPTPPCHHELRSPQQHRSVATVPSPWNGHAIIPDPHGTRAPIYWLWHLLCRPLDC